MYGVSAPMLFDMTHSVIVCTTIASRNAIVTCVRRVAIAQTRPTTANTGNTHPNTASDG